MGVRGYTPPLHHPPPHSGGYTRVPPVQRGPPGDRDAPWGSAGILRQPPRTEAVTPESLRSNLGRRGIGTPVGFLRRHSDTHPHTAADAPESLRSGLGRGGIGTPRGRYTPTYRPTAAVTPESFRSCLGRGWIWGAPLEALRWNPPPILAHMVGGGYHYTFTRAANMLCMVFVCGGNKVYRCPGA